MGHHFREQETHAKISRRTALQGIFSAGLIGTAPTTAEAETALDRLERLSFELSEALDAYQGGKFFAEVYPSQYAELPVAWKSLRTLEPAEKLRMALAQIKASLTDIHPHATIAAQRFADVDTQNVTYMITVRYPELAWSGPGLYRLICDNKGRVETFWVDRYWSEDDRQWMYAAAWRLDGYNVGARDIYSESSLRIIEKLEGDV